MPNEYQNNTANVSKFSPSVHVLKTNICLHLEVFCINC